MQGRQPPVLRTVFCTRLFRSVLEIRVTGSRKGRPSKAGGGNRLGMEYRVRVGYELPRLTNV